MTTTDEYNQQIGEWSCAVRENEIEWRLFQFWRLLKILEGNKGCRAHCHTNNITGVILAWYFVTSFTPRFGGEQFCQDCGCSGSKCYTAFHPFPSVTTLEQVITNPFPSVSTYSPTLEHALSQIKSSDVTSIRLVITHFFFCLICIFLWNLCKIFFKLFLWTSN